MYVNYEKIEHPVTFGDLRSLIQANDTPFQVGSELLEDPTSRAYYDAYLSRQGRSVATCPPGECLFPCFIQGQAIVDVPKSRHVAYHILSEAVVRSNYRLHRDEAIVARRALVRGRIPAACLPGWRGGLISALMWSVEGPRASLNPLLRVRQSGSVTRHLAVNVLALSYKVGAQDLEKAGQQFVLDLLTEIGPDGLRHAFQEAIARMSRA